MTKIMLLVMLCTIPVGASARVIISEIMYDLEGGDSKREWIEIYNSGTESVSLANWRFVEGGKRHTLSVVTGTETLSANAYAIIADNAGVFLDEHASYTGTLFDSSFSLKNSGEELVLLDAEGVTSDSVTYTSEWGGAGTGESVHYDGEAWVSGTPSPGVGVLHTTQASTTPVTNEATTTPVTVVSGSVSAHAHQRALGRDVYTPPLRVSIGRNRIAATGAPVSFLVDVIEPEHIVPHDVRWTFGDGMHASGSMAQRTYSYPGEYIVFANITHNKERVVARAEVMVFSPKIHITQATSDFVELFNETEYELNLGQWSIRTEGGKTVLPEDTLVKAHTLIRIPREALRYPASAAHAVMLEDPRGVIIATFEPMSE